MGPELGCWVLAFHRALGDELMDSLVSVNSPTPPAVQLWVCADDSEWVLGCLLQP